MEVILSGSGNDYFVFAAEGVQLAGGRGRVDGGGGVNTLDYSAYTAGVTVDLNTGAATGLAGLANIRHVVGGSGDDALTGDAAANILTGNDGDDTLNGGDGDDMLDGGGGEDTLDGGDGNDALNGGAGADQLNSDAGDDTFDGGDGDDAYRFTPGFGADVIAAATAGDTLDFSAFTADLNVTFGGGRTITDALTGSTATLAAGAQTGRLLLGSGDDRISFEQNVGFQGSLDAGAGTDTLTFANSAVARSVALTGLGAVDGFAGAYSNLQSPTPNTGFTNIDVLTGGPASDTLTGMNAASTWTVDASSSYQSGGRTLPFSGFENLHGGSAADTFNVSGRRGVSLAGNGGDDRFVFTNAAAISGSLDGGADTDTLDLSAFNTAHQVTLTSLGALDGFAGSVSNLQAPISSISFTNLDVLAAGGGADTLLGLNSAAVWDLDANGGDRYQSGGHTLAFSGAETLSGGGAADTFRISGAHDLSLQGGGGDDRFLFIDTLAGAGGGSISGDLAGGAGSDTLDFSDYVDSGAPYGFAVRVDLDAGDSNVTGGSISEIETITGSIGRDWLVGGSQGETFSGGPGDDMLEGGGGDDMLYGGPGDDRFSMTAKAMGIGMILVGGGGDDTLDYSNLTPSTDSGQASGVRVDFGAGSASGLAGFSGIASAIGGSGNDYFVAGGPGRSFIYGGEGYDIAVNVRCGYDVVVDVEAVQCLQNPAPVSQPVVQTQPVVKVIQSRTPLFIVIRPGDAWVRLPVTIARITLIDYRSTLKIQESLGGQAGPKIEYQHHLQSGPKYPPEAGNYVALSVTTTTSALLSHIEPAEISAGLASGGQRWILGKDDWSRVLGSSDEWRAGAPLEVLTGLDDWLLPGRNIPLRVGEFVKLARHDLPAESPGPVVGSWAVLSALEIELESQGVSLKILDTPMLVSFAITAEMLERFDALGILYYDAGTGDYVLLEADIVYWDPNAHHGSGGWASEPHSADAMARMVAEQVVTGRFILVGLSK